MAYKQHQIMTYIFTALGNLLRDFLVEYDVPVLLFEDEEKVESHDGVRCLVGFLGFREIRQHNKMAKIQIKKFNAEGKEIEFLVKPPFMFEMKIAAVFDGSRPDERLTQLSSLLGFLKENNLLGPGEFDWAGNNGAAVPVEVEPLDATYNELLPIAYRHLRPYALQMSVTVGLESTEPEGFTRVKERKFNALKKKE